MTRSEFLKEMSEIVSQIDELFDRYGNREDLVSIILAGTVEQGDDGNKYIKAIYGYNIYDENELDELLSFIKTSFENPRNIDLGDFDIHLN